MNAANMEMLERAAAALDELPDELVFVGGATIELWATDDAAPGFRPTEDVDVIVEIATKADYYRFEERLEAFRSRGKNDLFSSKDFDDVIGLVDSRAEIVSEVEEAKPDVRAFLGAATAELLDHDAFDSAGEGALRGGPETQRRFELVLRPRIEAIAAVANAVQETACPELP